MLDWRNNAQSETVNAKKKSHAWIRYRELTLNDSLSLVDSNSLCVDLCDGSFPWITGWRTLISILTMVNQLIISMETDKWWVLICTGIHIQKYAVHGNESDRLCGPAKHTANVSWTNYFIPVLHSSLMTRVLTVLLLLKACGIIWAKRRNMITPWKDPVQISMFFSILLSPCRRPWKKHLGFFQDALLFCSIELSHVHRFQLSRLIPLDIDHSDDLNTFILLIDPKIDIVVFYPVPMHPLIMPRLLWRQMDSTRHMRKRLHFCLD